MRSQISHFNLTMSVQADSRNEVRSITSDIDSDSTYSLELNEHEQQLSGLQAVPSRLEGLSSSGLKLDVRAHQRTYEGAYTRTALGCLSFSLLLIKLFSTEFLPIGIIYTLYGCFVYLMGALKARTVDFYYNPAVDKHYFKTSGNSVLLLSTVSLACYVSLFVLIVRM